MGRAWLACVTIGVLGIHVLYTLVVAVQPFVVPYQVLLALCKLSVVCCDSCTCVCVHYIVHKMLHKHVRNIVL